MRVGVIAPVERSRLFIYNTSIAAIGIHGRLLH